jgi:hypothetical protein
MTTRAGEGEKFVNYSLGGKGACDEIVSFPKNAPDAKGNKTLVSAHSGYAVELVGYDSAKKLSSNRHCDGPLQSAALLHALLWRIFVHYPAPASRFFR